MHKIKRLEIIEKIIREENISSQEVLLQRLKEEDFDCTQATLSRNLRQLGAGKIADGKGGLKYSLPHLEKDDENDIGSLHLLPAIIDVIDAKELLVIKTLPGNASNTAIYIDGNKRFEIAGTIAGDDTVLIIPRNGITNKQIHNCLEIILPGLHKKIKK